MTTASEDIGNSLGQILALVFQSILPTHRKAAEGIILLLVLTISLVFQWPQFEWWQNLAVWCLEAAGLQVWTLAVAVAVVIALLLLAVVDFVHLDTRGPWSIFYAFTAFCWLVALVWAFNAWPYEDSFGLHLAFTFLLYAAVASVYGAATMLLKRAFSGRGNLKQVAEQRVHGDARAASEPEVIAALNPGKTKSKPRKFDE